jgi:hypothetical protein
MPEKTGSPPLASRALCTFGPPAERQRHWILKFEGLTMRRAIDFEETSKPTAEQHHDEHDHQDQRQADADMPVAVSIAVRRPRADPAEHDQDQNNQ